MIARYDDRGFSTQIHGDATIRSHDMDVSADWIRDSDFGVLNTALLDDGRTLVLSSGVGGLKAALDARFVDDLRAPPATVVAGRLGRPLSGAIEIGPDACRSYDPHAAPGRSDANDALLAEVGTLHPWVAMGLGTYRDENGIAGSSARYTFSYGTPADAAADLAGRARLADVGRSMRTRQPYAESVLRLVDFDVDGAAIDLLAASVDETPLRFQKAFFMRDLLFATCS